MLVIVKPETVIGWHRKGFRLYWTWKSRRCRGGRPPIPRDVRALISRMSHENPLWGAPRIHGELLKLGIKVSEATVSKYLARHPKPPSQTWRTFLGNHSKAIASIDFFVLPTATFRLLMVFIVLHHERRQVVHFGVTAHPTAAWVAQQITEAFPWDSAPRYVIRDRDNVYYHHRSRTHLSLGKDSPVPRPVEGAKAGKIIALPQVGGLHHRYERLAA